MPRSRRSSVGPSTSILIMIVAVVAVLAAGTLFLMRHNKAVGVTTKPSASPTPTIQGPAKTGTAPAGPEAPGAIPSASPTTITNPTHPAQGSTLAAPTGDLLNARTMSLSSATPNMSSTCQATPGANCQIDAVMGNQTVIVGASQTIPDSGTFTVVWNWDITKLSVGSWTVTAVASLNGQTATSNPETLTVTK